MTPATPHPALAFIDVDVLPMDRPGELQGQTILIRDGLIEEIGAAAEVRVPEGAVRIDGRGKFLMPGLTDMHVHYQGGWQLALWLANGVTTVRHMTGTPEIVRLRERIRRGEVLGPDIYTSGPILNEKGAINIAVKSRAHALEVVAMHVEIGYDFVKVYDEVSSDAYEGLVEAAASHGLPVIGHVPVSIGIERALEAGQRCIEHLTGYDLALQPDDSPFRGNWGNPARFQGWRYAAESKMASLAEKTARAGAWNNVTEGVYFNKLARPVMEREIASRPEMRYAPAPLKAEWLTRYGWVGRMTDEAARDVRLGDGKRRRMIRALRDAGAPITLGTDEPDPLLVAGFCTQRELRHLVDAGLTPFEALQAGTFNAAACLGAGHEFGAVKAGLRADLVLLEANPLDDIANASRVAGVMTRGKWIGRREIDGMLEGLIEPA